MSNEIQTVIIHLCGNSFVHMYKDCLPICVFIHSYIRTYSICDIMYISVV